MSWSQPWRLPARELAVGIVLNPPVRLHLRPLREVVNQITVGLLPPAVRRMPALLVARAAGVA